MNFPMNTRYVILMVADSANPWLRVCPGRFPRSESNHIFSVAAVNEFNEVSRAECARRVDRLNILITVDSI